MSDRDWNWPLYGGIAGSLGTLAFAAFWSLAALMDGSWVFGVDALSDLGGDSPGRCFFNTGAILSGLLLVVFCLGLARILIRGTLAMIGTRMLAASAIALMGIGVFPETSGEIHLYLSWTFFILAMVSLLLLVRPALRSEVFRRMGAAITLAVPFGSIITLLATMRIPLAEGVSVILFMVWGLTMSLFVLLNLRAGTVQGH